MAKYYVFLFLVMAAVLYYIYIEDPCNRTLRLDFSSKYPDYAILDSGAGEVSTGNVRCHITYRKPDSDQVYEDVWLYKDIGDGWVFSKIVSSSMSTQQR